MRSAKNEPILIILAAWGVRPPLLFSVATLCRHTASILASSNGVLSKRRRASEAGWSKVLSRRMDAWPGGTGTATPSTERTASDVNYEPSRSTASRLDETVVLATINRAEPLTVSA